MFVNPHIFRIRFLPVAVISLALVTVLLSPPATAAKRKNTVTSEEWDAAWAELSKSERNAVRKFKADGWDSLNWRERKAVLKWKALLAAVEPEPEPVADQPPVIEPAPEPEPLPDPNLAPSISGTAPAVAEVGQFYDFLPEASDPNGDTIRYWILNQPAWADFDPTTGALYGTPTTTDAGHYDAIRIVATDGELKAKLADFSIDVVPSTPVADEPPVIEPPKSATLQWYPPVTNTDGSPVELAGYRVYARTDGGAFAVIESLDNPGLSSLVVENLPAGVWTIAMTAVGMNGMESVLSNDAVWDLR